MHLNLLCLYHAVPQGFIEQIVLFKGRMLSPEVKLVPACTELMQEAGVTPPGGRSNSAVCSPCAPRTSCFLPNEEQLPGIKARLAAPRQLPGDPQPLAGSWPRLPGTWEAVSR